jgi:catechol 2,3-dioxygenase-like lactoylglutathione lyase family enzyme
MAEMVKFDHLVIRVRDLDAALSDYSALGLTVTPGGEHPTLGSKNALIPFADDTYIELIAFKPREAPVVPDPKASPMVKRVGVWEASKEGMVDFALVPGDAGAALAAAKQRGLVLDGPFPGSRKRPDGQEVAWQFGVPASFDLPFLCADVTPRGLRVPGGAAREHPVGAVGFHRLVVGVENLAESVQRYKALLGVEPNPPAPLLEGMTDSVEFAIGGASIALLEIEKSPPLTRPFVARKVGPVLAFVRVKGEYANRPWDFALTHGAVIIGV